MSTGRHSCGWCLGIKETLPSYCEVFRCPEVRYVCIKVTGILKTDPRQLFSIGFFVYLSPEITPFEVSTRMPNLLPETWMGPDIFLVKTLQWHHSTDWIPSMTFDLSLGSAPYHIQAGHSLSPPPHPPWQIPNFCVLTMTAWTVTVCHSDLPI